jgi:hypothetical protein
MEVEHVQGEKVEPEDAGQVEHKEAQVEEVKEGNGEPEVGLVRLAGDEIKQNRKDIHHQQVQKGVIHADGQSGPDEIIKHKDQQHQNAGDHKIIIPHTAFPPGLLHDDSFRCFVLEQNDIKTRFF